MPSCFGGNTEMPLSSANRAALKTSMLDGMMSADQALLSHTEQFGDGSHHLLWRFPVASYVVAKQRFVYAYAFGYVVLAIAGIADRYL